MAARKRDYKKEYAQRVAKAKRQGFTGYGQKRRVRRQAVEKMMGISDRANRKSIIRNMDRMDMDDLEALLDLDYDEIRELAKTDSLYHYK